MGALRVTDMVELRGIGIELRMPEFGTERGGELRTAEFGIESPGLLCAIGLEADGAVNGFGITAPGAERTAGVAVETEVRGAAGPLTGGLFQTADEEDRVLATVAGVPRAADGTTGDAEAAVPAVRGTLTEVDLWLTAEFGTAKAGLCAVEAVPRTEDWMVAELVLC
jgi:hypothetical protein